MVKKYTLYNFNSLTFNELVCFLPLLSCVPFQIFTVQLKGMFIFKSFSVVLCSHLIKLANTVVQIFYILPFYGYQFHQQ